VVLRVSAFNVAAFNCPPACDEGDILIHLYI
jgi:hypothetical protein